MKAKKVWSLLLVMAMTTGLFSVCGEVSAETTEESAQESTEEDYVDIEVWSTNVGFLPVEKDGVMYNFYKDLIGVGITQPYVEWNGGTTYQEQLNLRIASGDAPDVFILVNGMESDLIQEGALLDLTDLLPEYAPHLWEAIPESVWDNVKSADPTGEGRIYYMPQIVDYTRHSGLIRQDWLDNLGLEMPTTQEEFVEVLRAFKNEDPNGNGQADEIPTGGRAEARWMDNLFSMYGIAMWEGYPQWDIYDGELTYSAVTDNMRDALEFISGLYEEGLIDPESLLNDKAAWDSKVKANTVGVYFQWAEQTYMYATDTKSALDVEPEWSVLPAISADGYEGFYTMMPTSAPAFAVSYTEDEEVIKSALKVLDSLADPEVSDALYVGPEGMWSEKDSNGVLKRLPEDTATMENAILKPVDFIANVDNVISALKLSGTDEDAWAVDKSIENVQEVQQYGKTIAGDGLPSYVYDGYEDIQNRTLYVEYVSKIITGEWSIDKFDEFVEEWYATGGEEVTQRAREWYESKQQ